MTTPAVNENVSFTGTARKTTRWFNNTTGALTAGPTVTNLSPKIGQRTRVRPASATSPILSDGWRSCKPWSHSGRNWELRGEPNKRVVISGNTRVEETFEGIGSFWQFVLPGLPSLPNTNMKSRAEVKALNELKNQNIHLGQFIAEAQRTANLIGNRSSQIAAQVRKYRALHPKLWKRVKKWQTGKRLAKRFWSRIPSNWLELQYGWKPLLSDVYGALAHLNQVDRGPLIHVEGRVTDTSTRDITLGTGLSGVSCYARLETKATAYVNLWYELNSPALAEFSQLGLVNPIEICWELLPYSFVVDWFLPIGPWLSALTGDVGFSFKGGSYSAIARERGIGSSGTSNFPSSQGAITGARGWLSGEAFSFSRTCYSSSPVPGFYVKNPFSLVHMLNGLALLSRAFR